MKLNLTRPIAAPHLPEKSEKYLWLGILIFSGLLYYSAYIFSVIPPQTGWWQYMAQRLLDGELLYQDVFLYVPPYFAWLTAALYWLLDGSFFAFTLVGLLLFRALPWALSYLIMTRFAKPAVCAAGVFTSICITSSYLMDQAYDYNPLIMMLALLQAYLLLRAHETDKPKNFYLLATAQGVLCGVQLMLKQNVGIVMPVVTLPILLYVAGMKGKGYCLRAGLAAVTGMIVAVLPGVVYLLATQTMDDFWWCITTALGAKMGEDNILSVAYRNFIRWEDLRVALVLGILYLFCTKKRGALKGGIPLLAALCGFMLAVIYRQYLLVFWEYVTLIRKFKLILFILAGVIAVGIAVLCYLRIKSSRIRLSILIGGFFAGFLFIRIAFPRATNDFAEYFYYTLDWYSLKTHVLYTLLYFNIFLWFESLYYGVIRKDEVKKSYFIVNSLYMGFMAVSFASASLEELYALLLVPSVANALFICLSYQEEEPISNRVSKALATTSVLAVALCICSLCLIQKIYIPYEWHSWRSDSLLEKEKVSVDIEGLRGFQLSEKDANTYKEILTLIEENSDEDDLVYQFPNIPLFNVLSERKTLYVAIPYFDVCPDSLAIESADQLRENPPKVFIYANLNDYRWYIHEEVFRGGKPSGQREIQKFYQEVVTSQYTCLGAFDNNEGETIEVWLKNE